MTKQGDPLALVRESRIRLSHEHGNDPKRLIATIRDEERKYVCQTERYRRFHAHVAEGQAEYGGKADE